MSLLACVYIPIVAFILFHLHKPEEIERPDSKKFYMDENFILTD
tara:strand:- start:14214 stop:14345 length:132 start_codon:yes stop_codon:yes gene_type:complete